MTYEVQTANRDQIETELLVFDCVHRQIVYTSPASCHCRSPWTDTANRVRFAAFGLSSEQQNEPEHLHRDQFHQCMNFDFRADT